MGEYAVVNPATGLTVRTYPTITDAELRDAITSADDAHRTWSASSTIAERAALVRRVSELNVERARQLGEIIVREMGKPIAQAVGEVEFCAAIYEFYADNAESLMADEPKRSGFDRELGRLGADEFVNKKLIRIGGCRPKAE